ncbi:MAG: NAD(+) synthase, partial [Candidatus Saccharimonas sp.]
LTPLSGLNKRQGRQLLVELNAPQSLIQKVPTADLLDDCPAQSDEAELGVSYEAIDDYLEGKDISPSDAELIEQRFLTSAHKRAMPVAYPGTV